MLSSYVWFRWDPRPGVTQAFRTRALNDVKMGRISVLVATDVAARGLDVPGVEHVVNYDLPMDGDTYVHRIGRLLGGF